MPFSLYFRCFHYLRYLQPPWPASITITFSFPAFSFATTAASFDKKKTLIRRRTAIVISITYFFNKKHPLAYSYSVYVSESVFIFYAFFYFRLSLIACHTSLLSNPSFHAATPARLYFEESFTFSAMDWASSIQIWNSAPSLSKAP